MVGGRGHHGIPLEVVGTVIEMADVAWYALEHRPGRTSAEPEPPAPSLPDPPEAEADEAARLQSENLRLRTQLADNLALLQGLYKAPTFSQDCPPDLYERLSNAVDGSGFLSKLELLHQEPKDDTDIAVDVDGEQSWWVWVAHKISPESLEEVSEIDDENYVIIRDENVIDGIANFIARCIVENPKSKMLSPEELHKAVASALASIKERMKWRSVWEAGKVIYTLSTWGIALAGLYRHRAILKAAAKGVGATSKLVMRAL